jgi:hypothetical protein
MSTIATLRPRDDLRAWEPSDIDRVQDVANACCERCRMFAPNSAEHQAINAALGLATKMLAGATGVDLEAPTVAPTRVPTRSSLARVASLLQAVLVATEEA